MAAAAAKLRQLCPTLCDPIDGNPPGSPVPGTLQARTLEWVATSLSNAWKLKVKAKSLSHVRPLATPWAAAHQAPPSKGFSRQEYWSGVPLPSPWLLSANLFFTWKAFLLRYQQDGTNFAFMFPGSLAMINSRRLIPYLLFVQLLFSSYCFLTLVARGNNQSIGWTRGE